MPRPMCINLRERYGDVYRITHDESYHHERTEFRSIEEPWLQVIPGRYASIYPHGGELLAVSTHERTSGRVNQSLRRKLLAIPGVEPQQDGGDGIDATFPVEAFDAVAELVKARRRRRLSPEQRAKLLASGEPYRFAGSKVPNTEPGSTIATPDDILATP